MAPVPLRHFQEPPAPGTEFEIVVVGFSADEQMYDCLIPGGSVEVLDWSDVQEGVVVEATITGHNKGRVGMRGQSDSWIHSHQSSSLVPR